MAQMVVNGVRTHWEEFGSGPPLVLVHGLGGTGTDIWKHQIAALAEDLRVILYDLRGSGESDLAPGPYTIDLLADDLAALVEGVGLAETAVMGHSMGGSIALRFAATRPERARAVVAVGAPTRLPDQGREALETRAQTVERDGMAAVAEAVATAGLAPSFREAHAEEYQELISLLASNDVAGYAAQCRALVAMDLTDDLPSVAAPTLLVCGELDAVSPPAVNEENVGRLRDGSIIRFDDCAHIVPWEKPDELLAAARSFVLER